MLTMRIFRQRLLAVTLMIGAALVPFSAWSADRMASPAGMAWKVQGEWAVQSTGRPIHSGDPLLPGELVQPRDLGNSHSLTVLLPDGQQSLYECFTPEDCARGFRIPALVAPPSPFAADMLSRIRRVVRAAQAGAPQASAFPLQQHRTRPAMDEAVVLWDGAGAVPVGGLLTALPDGRYTYALKNVSTAAPLRGVQVLEKSSGTSMVPVPEAGLYDMVVSDAQGVERVDMFVAVLDAKHQSLTGDYRKARKLIDGWNEKFTGWPEHELLRAYLQSWLSSGK